MGWARHEARMGEMIITYILKGNPEGKRVLGRAGDRGKYDILYKYDARGRTGFIWLRIVQWWAQ